MRGQLGNSHEAFGNQKFLHGGVKIGKRNCSGNVNFHGGLRKCDFAELNIAVAMLHVYIFVKSWQNIRT